jgi:predicted nucleic acid-binding protein
MSLSPEILSLLEALPKAALAGHEEVLYFIEQKRLMRKGLGYIDMHLLASARLSEVSLWTLDNPFKKVAFKLALSYG